MMVRADGYIQERWRVVNEASRMLSMVTPGYLLSLRWTLWRW